MTNRKSHELLIGTKLGDFGWSWTAYSSPNRRVISPNSVAFRADYVKVVEDTPILSEAEM